MSDNNRIEELDATICNLGSELDDIIYKDFKIDSKMLDELSELTGVRNELMNTFGFVGSNVSSVNSGNCLTIIYNSIPDFIEFRPCSDALKFIVKTNTHTTFYKYYWYQYEDSGPNVLAILSLENEEIDRISDRIVEIEEIIDDTEKAKQIWFSNNRFKIDDLRYKIKVAQHELDSLIVKNKSRWRYLR